MAVIHFLGAIDRYNYGDVLFPVLLEEYIEKYWPALSEQYSFDYYALREGNLESVGARAAQPLWRLYDRCRCGDVILIVGGEVLDAQAGGLFLDLCGKRAYPFYHTLLRVMRKAGFQEAFHRFAAGRLHVGSTLPFLLRRSDFTDRPRIFYNAVGGHGLGAEKAEQVGRILASDCDFISVRDRATLALLGLDEGRLAPDSATVMSDLFPADRLLKMCRREVADYISGGRYLCFQCSLRACHGHIGEYAKQLYQLQRNHPELRILLLPIGFAANHDDPEAERLLRKATKARTDFLGELSIFEVMCLIAHAGLFIGTSLHGNITAMSYGVPHLGLVDRTNTKLSVYLETWGDGGYLLSDPDEISDRADAALRDSERFRRNADAVVLLAKEALDRMISAIMEEGNGHE